MLRELHIKNVAVIDEASVEFGKGFNVLTGETGAGKSILIDSINMALGARSSRDLIRGGEEKAIVDTVFEIEDEATRAELEELGVEVEDGFVYINRTMTADGRSVCRINGRPTPLSTVRDAGRLLLNIHGQHDNHALLNPKLHLDFVDSYGGLTETKERYRAAYKAVRDIERELDELARGEAEKAQRADMLKFQIEEIDAAKLKAGEEEELERRRSYLGNIGKIAGAASEAYEKLYSGEGMQQSAYDLISAALRSVGEAAEFDPDMEKRRGELSNILAELEESAHDLKNTADNADFDPNEINLIEERINLIYGLKRKYGSGIGEILEYGERARAELEKIENSDEYMARLSGELAAKKEELRAAAAELSKRRGEVGAELSERVNEQLRELDMNVVFEVGIQPKTDADGEAVYDAQGAEDIEFMISANPNEPMKPLAKIASGGEMSRIMLALKSVFADSDRVETLIFDEIDTGISGRAAQRVAEKLKSLSEKRQTLCITHLAQIASMADSHYLIEKNVDGERASTKVTPLGENERVRELARIIGGVKVTDLTLKNAREMLSMARRGEHLI